MEQNKTGFSTESLRLIGAALALQQATRTAANIVPLPGTALVVIGTPAEVARLLDLGPAFANDGRKPDWSTYAAAETAEADVEHDLSEGGHVD